MKIVVVDAFTLNPGDLSWEKVSKLGDIKVYDRTSSTEIIERCMDAEVIITNKVAFNQTIISQLPKLKLIIVSATGFNIIDTTAATTAGIVVCNVPDYGTDSVAQHTFALILDLTNRVNLHSLSVHQGAWVNSPDFSYALTPLIELKDKTLGLVGFGSIGQKTAEIARAFGMKVIYYTPTQKDTSLATYSDLEMLFKESDFISLHLPLKPENKEFVNRKLLILMKSGAFLINTSRGALINEQDLADALNSDQIAGAALDVLSAEPPSVNNPLLNAKNCIITPHNAWMSTEARERIMEIVYQNLKAYQDKTLINSVN
ncbi:MAG: D-2-hydroxyacid dehydrogenase [Pyrinomonadaceae bacterium]|nr:D-2-hydroxyacid dehydrogenase [Sphingobacteriaceae bacterium]